MGGSLFNMQIKGNGASGFDGHASKYGWTRESKESGTRDVKEGKNRIVTIGEQIRDKNWSKYNINAKIFRFLYITLK